ncbi:MAG: class sortase [Candidatus Saccharibacteria bacterium]|nr:class sortase [Candidatus Saccharibacteria bacterium]
MPPDGNYHDVFVWTLRGLPGDGATDTTYLFGHTYSGATNGVLDNLRYIVFDDHHQVIKGTKLHVTTKAGELTYCVSNAYTVPKEELQDQTQAAIWAITPYAVRGNFLVIIACFLSDDGSEQTGDNLAVVAERC